MLCKSEAAQYKARLRYAKAMCSSVGRGVVQCCSVSVTLGYRKVTARYGKEKCDPVEPSISNVTAGQGQVCSCSVKAWNGKSKCSPA